MRYYINFDKTINQLVPHYIGGRKTILFLQAILHPLRSLNDRFVEWAKETRIEMSMTSQVFPFEWFLNRKLKQYFLNGDERISISHSQNAGVPLYHEDANVEQSENMVLYTQSESVREQFGEPLFYAHERTGANDVSFVVSTPQIDESLITREAYIAMLSYYIDRYRLANKTYNIKFSV